MVKQNRQISRHRQRGPWRERPGPETNLEHEGCLTSSLNHSNKPHMFIEFWTVFECTTKSQNALGIVSCPHFWTLGSALEMARGLRSWERPLEKFSQNRFSVPKKLGDHRKMFCGSFGLERWRHGVLRLRFVREIRALPHIYHVGDDSQHSSTAMLR